MNDLTTTRLEALLAERTGLKLRPRQRELLYRNLISRMSALRLDLFDEYQALLQLDNPSSEAEWQRIVSRLINKESYFFRDQGQMTLLRDQILPELIAKNATTRTLRVWSAGCSTGEEAYSLAILINGLLPAPQNSTDGDWDVRVLGTDIDEQALNVGRRGMYGAWSFRMVDIITRQRYFEETGGQWQVTDACRSLVAFEQCNLVADKFPGSQEGNCGFDLILCRNVFIYFEPRAVSKVLQKFSEVLREGGYLMTGHVESRNVELPRALGVRSFPGSAIYQRNSEGSPALPPIQDADLATVRASTTVPKFEAKRAFLPLPISSAVDAPAETAAAPPTAQALADMGNYDEAIAECQRLLEANPFASEAYEILSCIAQEQGRNEDAKTLLKKAIYLVPMSPYLYADLGTLYRNEGDEVRALQVNRVALELLSALPLDAVSGRSGRPSVREYIDHLTEITADGD